MKIIYHKIIFLSCFILINHYSKAQFNFGLKGGLNLSDFYVNSEQDDIYKNDYNSRTSFHIGAFGSFELTDKVFIQTELLYSVKRFNYPTNDVLGRNQNGGEIELNYFCIPLLFGYRLTDKFSILAGCEYSYLLSSDDDSRELNWINERDFGLVGNLQYNPLEKINLSCRYVHGLTSQAEIIINPDLADYKNRTFQLSIAYQFL